MRHSRGHRVGVAAWSLAGFTMLVLATALVLLGLDTSKMATDRIAIYGIGALAVVVYAGTGRLIASRVPGNAIGWLLGLIGLRKQPGGKDSYEDGRRFAERLLAVVPDAQAAARASKNFLARTVRFLVEEASARSGAEIAGDLAGRGFAGLGQKRIQPSTLASGAT